MELEVIRERNKPTPGTIPCCAHIHWGAFPSVRNCCDFTFAFSSCIVLVLVQCFHPLWWMTVAWQILTRIGSLVLGLGVFVFSRLLKPMDPPPTHTLLFTTHNLLNQIELLESIRSNGDYLIDMALCTTPNLCMDVCRGCGACALVHYTPRTYFY